MNSTQYAKRRSDAIKQIAEITGVDLAKIRNPNTDVMYLLQLEKLASEVTAPGPKKDIDDIMGVVSEVPGVGVALGKKISKALEVQYGG